MACNGFARTILIVTLICTGCSSSSSTQPPSEMEKMAAALDKPTSASAAAAPSNNAASTASASPNQTAQPAAASTNAPADSSLRTKRGFALEDTNEAAYVLVKADVNKTADALAKAWKTKVVKDVLGKPVDDEVDQVVVYQLAGHPWSVFTCDADQFEALVGPLSRDAEVLTFWNSDFTAWSSVQLFRGGQEVEALNWGGSGERIGEDADDTKWHAKGEVTRTVDGQPDTEVFQFRSSLRKINPADLQKGHAFVNDFFRHHDAYLLDADQIWPDSESSTFHSSLSKDAFAGVHAVEAGEE